MNKLMSLLRGEDGQTTVEYALIVTLVIALAIASITVINPPIGSLFNVVVDRLSAL